MRIYRLYWPVICVVLALAVTVVMAQHFTKDRALGLETGGGAALIAGGTNGIDTVTADGVMTLNVDVSELASIPVAATLLADDDYLTLTANSLDVDPEVVTDTNCIWFESPVLTDDFKSIWTTNGFAATITKIWCESDQTVNMDLQIDDGTPLDVAGADLVCDSTPAEDESGLTGSMADGDRLDLAITSVCPVRRHGCLSAGHT